MNAPLVKVGEVSDQLRGVSYGKADAVSTAQEGYLPVLRAGNITDCGLVFDDLVFVPRKRISQKQRIRKGDVVIAASSGSLDVVGKAAMALEDCDAGFGAFCKVMRPNPTKVDSAYFAHYFQTREYRQKISSLAAGANINNLRNEHLDDLLIPLPPLPEQRRIAAILDQADTLRAKRREALAELDQLKQSIFIEMFGDPVRGNGLYPVATVESIAAPEKNSIVDGPFGSSMKPDDYRESGIPVIRIANITKEGEFTDRNLLYIDKQLFEKLKRSRIMPYDVLVSRVGTIGNTCIFPEDIGDALLSTTGVCKITPNKTRMLPEFLHQAILQPSFQQQIHKSASTSVQKYFNLSALRGWSIITPPISVQSAFVEHLTMAQKQKGIQSRSLQDFDSLFSSLQHRAFRGEL